jgi:hypothetical protein
VFSDLLSGRPPGLNGEQAGAGVAQPDDLPPNALAFARIGPAEEIDCKDAAGAEVEGLDTAGWVGTAHGGSPQDELDIWTWPLTRRLICELLTYYLFLT